MIYKGQLYSGRCHVSQLQEGAMKPGAMGYLLGRPDLIREGGCGGGRETLRENWAWFAVRGEPESIQSFTPCHDASDMLKAAILGVMPIL